MVGSADCATKLYQTSFLLAIPQPMVGMVVYVALSNVPAVLLQVVPDVNVIAPEQASLAGGSGSVIQRLNVKSLELFEVVILTKYVAPTVRLVGVKVDVVVPVPQL